MSKFKVGQTLIMLAPKRFAGKKAVVLRTYREYFRSYRHAPFPAVAVRVGNVAYHPSGNSLIYPDTYFRAANSNGIAGFGHWLKTVVKA